MPPLHQYSTGFVRRQMNFDSDKVYVVSFSGGRSSAVMLRYLLETFGGKLPENFIVLFANTGKEHHGTLDFVRDIEAQWNVTIHWLEFEGLDEVKSTDSDHVRYKTVTHETAARNGEPWIKVIEATPGYAPRRAARLCTFFMKVGTMWSYLRDQGIHQFTNLVGYRADEVHRLHRELMKCGRDPLRPRVDAPLVHAGITKKGVLQFWADQPFDLHIPEGAGNCDLCFLKGRRQLMQVAYANPGMLDWWIEADRYAMELGATRPMLPDGGYAALGKEIQLSGDSFIDDDLSDLECGCTD